MLNKAQLKSDLQTIFEDVPSEVNEDGPSSADQAKAIGDAIVDYLGGANVGTTFSSVQFPGASAIPTLITILPPEISTPLSLPASIASAVTAGTAASLGGMDGAPIPPGTAIVSEIGLPPIVPVATLIMSAFASNDQTAADAAGALADAIHTSVTTILFTIVELVPTPVGPVPTPIPGIPIQ